MTAMDGKERLDQEGRKGLLGLYAAESVYPLQRPTRIKKIDAITGVTFERYWQIVVLECPTIELSVNRAAVPYQLDN